MNRKSVARAIFESIRRVAEADDEDEKKPPAGPEGTGDDEGPKGSERRGGDDEGPEDTGKGFAPEANMTIKDGDSEEPGEGEETKKELFQYIVTNRDPSDTQVHSIAKQLGVEPDELEGMICSIIGSFKAGRSVTAGLRTENVDPEELRMGIEVEAEHSDLPFVAERIAMDHLAEIPDYYSRLKKMEDEAKKAGSEADTNPQPDDDEPFPRSPTSWPNAPEKKEPEDGEDEEVPEVKVERKRKPHHSMDVHDGEGEDDGW